MVDTFEFCPGINSEGTITQRVQTSDFGDGYSQASSVGINNQFEQWNLTFSGKADEIAPIRFFLDRHKGDSSFYWTPPDGEQGRYRSSEYALAPQGNNVFRLTTTFTEVFEAASNADAEYVTSVNNIGPDADGNVTLTAIDVGADDRGAATNAITALKAEADPFPIYAKKSDIPDLNYIDEKFTELDGEITGINTDIANLTNDLGTTNNNLASLEGRVTVAETNLGSLTTTVRQHTEKLASLETDVSDNTTAIETINNTMVKSVNGNLPDATGNVTITVDTGTEIDDSKIATDTTWSSQKINQINVDFADTTDASKGAAKIGFNTELEYPTSTVGNALKNNITQITTLNQKVDELETWKNENRFTLLYPNGGSAEAPAEITVGNRYILDNPFPDSPVLCIAEIFRNEIWGETGWIWSASGGFGVKANAILESNQIIVQAGSGGVGYQFSPATGDPFNGTVNGAIARAMCRVKVWSLL